MSPLPRVQMKLMCRGQGIQLMLSIRNGIISLMVNKTKYKNGVQEGYIPVRGGNVWYRIVGSDKCGIPLLALHGGPGATWDYLEPLGALCGERPVVFYDQLGGGNSDRPDDTSLWTVECFTEELGTVREALDLEKVHILGQSWGSMLAVDYMLARKPHGIVSLILSGPCLSASRWGNDQRAYLLEMPAHIQKIIHDCETSGDFSSEEYQEAMMNFYRRHLCRMDPWPDCLMRTFEKMSHAVYEYMWGPSEFSIRGTLKNYERAERLRAIQVPVLFTCGRHDEATPASTSYYHEMLPGSAFVIFEDASHEHHIEKAGEYLNAVRTFLHRVEAHTKVR
jgi:proline-specific peptidase